MITCYYSSTPDFTGFFTFITIISVVWGILNVILFFKLWQMCDNVKKLAKNDSIPFREKFGAILLSGDKEKAYKLVEEKLLHDLLKTYYDYVDESQMLEEMESDIDAAKEYVHKTGFELPEHLSSAENFVAYRNKIYNP